LFARRQPVNGEWIMNGNEIKPTKMFKIIGPFRIKPRKLKNGRRIEKNQCEDFWREHAKAQAIRNRIGCYVFGIRASKGVRPVYVGKTWNSFDKEIFGSHQRDYYNAELAAIRKGMPVIFFIVYPQARGVPNKEMIRDVEQFLIQIAVAKNPNLRNVQSRGEKKWGIGGVIRSGAGKTSSTSLEFKKALGI
jgi:hypothetical protein